MSQLNVNALHQPDAAPLNGAPVGGQQIGAPAGLGNNHSVGRTIGRVIAAIFTLGISEAVLAIIRAVRAESAPAVPHLPQNRELSSHALRALEQGKSRALATLGAFCEVDAAALQKKLEKAVRNSPAQVEDAALEELAEKTAREVLVESIVKTALRDDPEGATVDAERKDDLVIHLLRTDQAQSLVNAPDAEAATALVATVKDIVHEHLRSLVSMAALQQELFSAGLESFRQATGCTEKLELGYLKNIMNITKGEVNKRFATTERPYAVAGLDDLRKVYKPKADLFFANRATAYNSIADLDLPDSIKTSWRKTCLQTRDGLAGNAFTIALATGLELANRSWDILLDSKQTVDQKLDFVHDIFKSRNALFEKAFGTEQFKEMGTDEKDLLVELVLAVIADKKAEMLASLRADHALVKALKAEVNVLQDQAANYVVKMKKVKEGMEPDETTVEIKKKMSLKAFEIDRTLEMILGDWK